MTASFIRTFLSQRQIHRKRRSCKPCIIARKYVEIVRYHWAVLPSENEPTKREIKGLGCQSLGVFSPLKNRPAVSVKRCFIENGSHSFVSCRIMKRKKVSYLIKFRKAESYAPLNEWRKTGLLSILSEQRHNRGLDWLLPEQGSKWLLLLPIM